MHIKINNTFIDNAEDLDIVMPKYNLLEYSDNYSMTSGNLWNYYRDETDDRANENDNNINNNNNNNNNEIINNITTTSKSFEYKTKIITSMPNDNNILDAEVVVPLKYLSKFWRSLDLLLIYCEIELDFRWTKNCVLSEISRTFRAVPNTDPVRYEMATATTNATFPINNAKLYVPVVTLSLDDNI